MPARPVPETVVSALYHEVSLGTFFVVVRKPSPALPALPWGLGLAMAMNLLGQTTKGI